MALGSEWTRAPASPVQRSAAWHFAAAGRRDRRPRRPGSSFSVLASMWCFWAEPSSAAYQQRGHGGRVDPTREGPVRPGSSTTPRGPPGSRTRAPPGPACRPCGCGVSVRAPGAGVGVEVGAEKPGEGRSPPPGANGPHQPPGQVPLVLFGSCTASPQRSRGGYQQPHPLPQLEPVFPAIRSSSSASR